MFFSLQISAEMLFTKHPFSFKFALSVLVITFYILRSSLSFFRDVVRSIMIFTILLAILSESRLLVPTWRIKWFGACFEESCIYFFSCKLFLPSRNVFHKSCSQGYLFCLTFVNNFSALLCYLLFRVFKKLIVSRIISSFVVAVVFWSVFRQLFFSEWCNLGIYPFFVVDVYSITVSKVLFWCWYW